MIDIEIDGFYCKECNTLHPTLFWHKQYDNYIKSKGESIILFKETAKKFEKEISDEEATKLYYKNMHLKGIEHSNESGECIICKTNTHYKHTKTKEFICSDKCKYKAR